MVNIVFSKQDRQKVLEKYPNSIVLSVDHNDLDFSFEKYISSVSLFGQKYIYQFFNIISDGAMEDLVANGPAMVDSPNIFIIHETEITEPRRKKLEALGFNVGKSVNINKKTSNEIFALSDAIYARDKKNAWVSFQTLSQTSAVEEIHGTLLWAVKMMRVYPYANDLGIKPFVASNANRASKKYTPNEIDNMHRQLVHIYHDAHNGKLDFNIALENWLIGL